MHLLVVSHNKSSVHGQESLKNGTKRMYKSGVLPVACAVSKCAFFFSGLINTIRRKWPAGGLI